MYKQGARAALAFAGQPSLGSVGIKAPTSAPNLPKPPATSAPKMPKAPAQAPTGIPAVNVPSVGINAAKVAFNVGMGASQEVDGAGSTRGEPAEEGRRQRSVIDRAIQRNEDDYATSSTPMPGAWVAP